MQQPIEAFWRIFREGGSQFWIDHFKVYVVMTCCPTRLTEIKSTCVTAMDHILLINVYRHKHVVGLSYTGFRWILVERIPYNHAITRILSSLQFSLVEEGKIFKGKKK